MPLFLSLASRLTEGDQERLAEVLRGLRRYQEAPAAEPMPAFATAAQKGEVRLLRVGGPENAPPVVVVPSLINAPAVLDLAPGKSLVRHMAGRGLNTYVIDWGPMTGSERRLGMAGLISMRLLPLIESLGRPVLLVGYCVGGTLAIAAAQLLGERLKALSLIAAPWHFDGFTPQARLSAMETYAGVRPIGKSLGAVPISLLNPLFWSLDEQSVINKFATLARRPEGDPHIGWFARVEDWANSGAPLTNAAARDLFVHGYGHNSIGSGRWKVRNMPIRPEAIAAPILDIGALSDRIVPPPARLRNNVTARIEVTSGHVGMVVGSAAPTQLWEPLSNWLLNA